MSIKKILVKNFITYKIYLYYNLYIRHKAFKKKLTYSQWGEDQIIKKFFENKKNGFYIDIGSFHPIMYSNTCCLYNSGWSGINIDLNQTSIDLFNIMRPNDLNVCAAISDKIEERDLYMDHQFSPVNTIHQSLYEAADKKILFKNLKKKKIKTQTFSNIIKKINELPKINFLNIDCEGNDYLVLTSIDLKYYKPELICIETHDVHNKETFIYKNIINLLEKFNYKIYQRCGPSTFFNIN
ncbi:FkbM family methyltransferase [bacterium]|nr:FkbM family methyltransferase [bacterium]